MTAERKPLEASALRDGLVGPGHFWRRLDVVDETGSTNDDLVAAAASGVDPAGVVLLTEHQTTGHGRNGRSWAAVPRAQVLMSVGVPVGGVPPAAWGWLPLLTGVAIVDALFAVTGLRAGLKWPNDVMVSGRKLAGVLAEVAVPGEVVVVGIGLNVTLDPGDIPAPGATSLHLLGHSVDDRTSLIRVLLSELARRVTVWRAADGDDARLIDDYRARNVTVGQWVRVLLPGDREIVGHARSVDDQGRLVIDDGSAPVAVSAGDIIHLRPYGDGLPG